MSAECSDMSVWWNESGANSSLKAPASKSQGDATAGPAARTPAACVARGSPSAPSRSRAVAW